LIPRDLQRKGPVLAASAALVSVVVLVVAMSYVVSRNAETAARAEAKAVAAQRVNRAQNVIRAELVVEFRRADRRLCVAINAVYERIRATVRVDDEQFLASLKQIGIEPDSAQAAALLEAAHEREQETFERFASVDCAKLPG